MLDLKLVYKAVSEDVAFQKLEKLKTKWETKYPLAVNSWFTNWKNLKTFFDFPEEIRKMIYTTNAVEALFTDSLEK